jgi:hypothetical protein
MVNINRLSINIATANDSGAGTDGNASGPQTLQSPDDLHLEGGKT